MLLVIPIDPPDVTLSSTTLSRLADITAEELLCLEAIYAASFLRLSGGGFRLKAAPLELTVRCSPSYPFIPPLVELCLAATSISRFQLFELEARIRAVIDFDELVSPEDCEAVLGGELCELVVDFAADLRGDDVALMHDRACECSDCIPNYAHADNISFNALSNSLRAFTRDCLGGRTPAGIAAELEDVQLLHHEYVARPFLIKRFQLHLERLQHRAVSGVSGRREKDRKVVDQAKVEITFHGTLRQNVGPIVRGGFFIPGKKNVMDEDVVVRCGSTWGRGIYSSPDPNYCLHYADTSDPAIDPKTWRALLPGMKLIVSAVAMGRRIWLSNAGIPRGGKRPETFDSCVSPSGKEWVLFNEAAILPLLVLHVAPKDPRAPKEIDRGLVDEGTTAVDRRARLAALRGMATKNLPFGFGEAGGRFVVEEVGEIDEDDEEWGELTSALRGEQDEFSLERERRIRNLGVS